MHGNILLFLDVLITWTSTDILETFAYRKHKHTDQILQFQSNHTSCHRRSYLKGIIPLQHNRAKEREQNHLFQMFLRYQCTRSFIKRRVNTKRHREATTEQIKTQTVLPYNKHLSEMTARLLKPHGTVMVHSPIRILRKILWKTKQPTADKNRTNVVY